jgi:hypothetical protein
MAHVQLALVSSGDLDYEVNLQLTGVIDVGITLEEALGNNALPPAGKRFDISWAETSSGLFSEPIKGIDYQSSALSSCTITGQDRRMTNHGYRSQQRA